MGTLQSKPSESSDGTVFCKVALISYDPAGAAANDQGYGLAYVMTTSISG
jgi:hypothetical protein